MGFRNGRMGFGDGVRAWGADMGFGRGVQAWSSGMGFRDGYREHGYVLSPKEAATRG